MPLFVQGWLVLSILNPGAPLPPGLSCHCVLSLVAPPSSSPSYLVAACKHDSTRITLKRYIILISLSKSNTNNLSRHFSSLVSFQFLILWVCIAAAHFLSLPSTALCSGFSLPFCPETRVSNENHLIAKSDKMFLISHQGTWLYFSLLVFSQFFWFLPWLEHYTLLVFSFLCYSQNPPSFSSSPQHTHPIRVVHLKAKSNHVIPLNAVLESRLSLTTGQQRRRVGGASWMFSGQGDFRLSQVPTRGKGPSCWSPVMSSDTKRGREKFSRSESCSDTQWLWRGSMHCSCS